MSYTAKIAGTVTTKVYINLIFFKIVRNTHVDPFLFTQTADLPVFDKKWDMIGKVPIGAEILVDESGATASLTFLGNPIASEHVGFPTGGKQSIHWSPIKGVQIDAVASFTKDVEVAPQAA